MSKHLRDVIKEAMKQPKERVGYSKSLSKERCGLCRFYNNHVCSQVQGFIRPAYWCRLWEKKS